MPSEHDPAPDFTLKDQDGREHTLSNYRGRKVILYFYPKDDTPGCTAQACGIRDRLGEIDANGAVVLGVSPDTVASHRRFADKYDLPFTLLSDPDRHVAELYDVWKKKTMYGRVFKGIERTSFVIDEEGRIAKILPRVKPAAHADQVIELLA